MDLSDSELIGLLIAVGVAAVILGLPACIRAWTLWHAKDPAANDPSARP